LLDAASITLRIISVIIQATDALAARVHPSHLPM
jgi:hypothetical protein